MVSNAGLWHHRDFQAELVSTASYLVNCSLCSSIDFKSPEEVWSGNPIECSILRIFGCHAYAHVNDGKLAPRAIKCMFLGYVSKLKGYHLWCLDSRKVICSRGATFNELTMFSPRKESTVSFIMQVINVILVTKVELQVPT